MATKTDVKKKQDRGVLVNAYASRFGEPENDQEAHGYWMFAAGLVLGLLGLFVLAFSTMPEPRSSAAFSGRQIAAILGGVGLPLLMLGIVYRLPIKKTADRVALVGALISLAAIIAFVVYYPSNWNLPAGSTAADYASIISGVYGIGLLVIGFAALVMPSMVGKKRVSEIEEREDDAFEREGAISGREEAVSRREEEVEEREEAVSRREKEVEEREEAVAGREEAVSKRGEEVEEHAEAVSEREAVVAQKEAAADEPEESKAEFEMFKDKGGEWRWNLRHQNGNIIADSAEGYSSKSKAKQGLDSVRKNVPGAPITEREEETKSESTGAAVEEDDEANAEYELYEDAADEWRWRLVASNGEIIADCGQGYGDRRDAEAGIDTVRGKAADADHLEITPAGFEVYKDEADEWRWRLIRRNGRIIADSGEGYTERSSAMEAVERVQSLSGETEVYEGEDGEWYWHHTASNGQIIADGGEGYSSEGAAEDAVERFENVAPEADKVEKGKAYFTVYKDAADEWRWRLVASNGSIVADSGEGYTERNDAVEALERVKEYSKAPTA